MFNQHFNEAGRHQAFLKCHGDPIQHLERPRLWLFADGAQYMEPHERGTEAQYAEPSPDRVRRLEVILAYLNARYTRTWQEFTRAESGLDVVQLRHLANEIMTLRKQMAEMSREYNAIPEVREKHERELEELERQFHARELQQEHEARVREEIRQIVAEVRSAGEVPPVLTQGDLDALNPFAQYERLTAAVKDAADLTSARMAGVATARPRRPARTQSPAKSTK